MNNHKQSQQGTVLVAGLILITAISLASVVTMESAVVQSRLATNTQLNVTSFQEAEAALIRTATPIYMIEAMNESSSVLTINYKNGVENISKGKYKNKYKLIKKKKYKKKEKEKSKYSKKYKNEKDSEYEKYSDKDKDHEDEKYSDKEEKDEDTETSDDGTSFVINSDIEYCGILPGENTRGISLNANQAANSDKNYVTHVFDITANVKQMGGKRTQSQHAQRISRLMLGTAGKTCT